MRSLLCYYTFAELPVRSVRSCVHTYVCVNKPIRGAIFNFNKFVSDLDIETCKPDS